MTRPAPARHEYFESQRIRMHFAVWGDPSTGSGRAKPPLYEMLGKEQG